MGRLEVALIDYGTNKKIKSVFMDDHAPAVGDFIIDDEQIVPNEWKDKMYVVRAVTHLHNSLLAVHVEKYNVDEENKKWEQASAYLDKLRGKLNTAKIR